MLRHPKAISRPGSCLWYRQRVGRAAWLASNAMGGSRAAAASSEEPPTTASAPPRLAERGALAVARPETSSRADRRCSGSDPNRPTQAKQLPPPAAPKPLQVGLRTIRPRRSRAGTRSWWRPSMRWPSGCASSRTRTRGSRNANARPDAPCTSSDPWSTPTSAPLSLLHRKTALRPSPPPPLLHRPQWPSRSRHPSPSPSHNHNHHRHRQSFAVRGRDRCRLSASGASHSSGATTCAGSPSWRTTFGSRCW